MKMNEGRRTFLKLSGKTALGFGALKMASAAGLIISLNSILDGCSTVSQTLESREDVGNIAWDANPAIPVPKNGCYAGWHRTLDSIISMDSKYFQYINQERAAFDADGTLRFYEQQYDKGPAVFSFSNRNVGGEFFPKLSFP